MGLTLDCAQNALTNRGISPNVMHPRRSTPLQPASKLTGSTAKYRRSTADDKPLSEVVVVAVLDRVEGFIIVIVILVQRITRPVQRLPGGA